MGFYRQGTSPDAWVRVAAPAASTMDSGVVWPGNNAPASALPGVARKPIARAANPADFSLTTTNVGREPLKSLWIRGTADVIDERIRGWDINDHNTVLFNA